MARTMRCRRIWKLPANHVPHISSLYICSSIVTVRSTRPISGLMWAQIVANSSHSLRCVLFRLEPFMRIQWSSDYCSGKTSAENKYAGAHAHIDAHSYRSHVCLLMRLFLLRDTIPFCTIESRVSKSSLAASNWTPNGQSLVMLLYQRAICLQPFENRWVEITRSARLIGNHVCNCPARP